MVLLCAACVPRSEGEQGMNPEQKAAVEVAEHLHSIEEFQRDVEPAIIAARNEFLTQERACQFFCVWGLEVGGDSVGVGGGELGEGLFPVGGGASLDEACGGCSFVGGFAGVCEALGGSFIFDVANSQP